MTSATEKSATDIMGFEYDWLGRDEDGHVALFTTAGAGYAPKAFLRDTDAHDNAIETVLALPASTTALFFPELDERCINTYKLVAERGLYAYDSYPNGGPYELAAAPQNPVRIETLPASVAEVAVRLDRGLRFQALKTIEDEMLQANDP